MDAREHRRPALAAASMDCQAGTRFSSQGSVGQAVTEAIREDQRAVDYCAVRFDNTQLVDELKLAKTSRAD